MIAAVLYQTRDLLLVHLIVHKRMVVGQHIVKSDTTNGCFNACASLVLLSDTILGLDNRIGSQADKYAGLQVDICP